MMTIIWLKSNLILIHICNKKLTVVNVRLLRENVFNQFAQICDILYSIAALQQESQ